MKDGYIGLVRSAREEDFAPIVTRCNISVEETSDPTGAYRALTGAKFSVTNLDVDPLSSTGITKVKVEMQHYPNKGEDAYLSADDNLPGHWQHMGTYIISDDSEITNNNNSAIFSVPNIPANTNGYNHKFRLTFLNKNDIPARLIPFYDGSAYDPYMGEPAVDIMIDGSLTSNIFTPTTSQEWNVDDHEGFSVQFYDDNNSPMFVSPAPIIQNDLTSLTITSGVPSFEGFDISSISKMRFEESIHFYVLGNDGTGKTFNGINDLNELVSVIDLQAEVSSGNFTSPNSSTAIEIAGQSLKLRWKNMYNHEPVEVTNASGSEVLISDEWISVNGYGLYMYVADDNLLPSAGLFPGSSNELNGKWFKVDEVEDKHFSLANKNYYEFIINDLPPGKTVGFWVGAFTPHTTTEVRNLDMRGVE